MTSAVGGTRVRSTLATLAALALLGGAGRGTVGCGGGSNELSGSIGESFNLGFDRVSVRKQAEALIVEYQKDVSGVVHKVCKLVVDTHALALGSGTRLSGDVFASHVQLSRITASGGDFPAVKSGQIQFDAYDFKAKGQVDGGFSVVFDNGRTLQGNFSGQIEEVATN